eukprot:g29038.t1
MYKVQVGEAILNKHEGHMKAANSQMVQEQNVPGSWTAFLEPMGSHPPSSIEETVEPLPPEEEDEFLLMRSGRKRRATLQYTPFMSEAASEEPDTRARDVMTVMRSARWTSKNRSSLTEAVNPEQCEILYT